MDVSAVHHNSTLLRYSVSLLGYGFYGDIIKDSEKKRWMGLIRYDFSGSPAPALPGAPSPCLLALPGARVRGSPGTGPRGGRLTPGRMNQ